MFGWSLVSIVFPTGSDLMTFFEFRFLPPKMFLSQEAFDVGHVTLLDNCETELQHFLEGICIADRGSLQGMRTHFQYHFPTLCSGFLEGSLY